MGRIRTVAALAAAIVVGTATAAGACGGLVGENGTIQLVRTTTLAAYHDGVERYVTSFEFTALRRHGYINTEGGPSAPTQIEHGATFSWTSTARLLCGR